jgi:hypothetical protein
MNQIIFRAANVLEPAVVVQMLEAGLQIFIQI